MGILGLIWSISENNEQKAALVTLQDRLESQIKNVEQAQKSSDIAQATLKTIVETLDECIATGSCSPESAAAFNALKDLVEDNHEEALAVLAGWSAEGKTLQEWKESTENQMSGSASSWMKTQIQTLESSKASKSETDTSLGNIENQISGASTSWMKTEL